MPAVIAIDGPAASGKSTIGMCLADKLGYLFFDTGVMYRAVTLAALQHGLDVNDGEAVGSLVEQLSLDITSPGSPGTDGRQSRVLVDGKDVTPEIRSPAVDRHVSAISAHERVRRALSRHQRRIGLQYGLGEGDKAGIVMVGRDIGTVVMREAPLKIYLDATPEERARRRYEELRAKGITLDYDSVLRDVVRRDDIDSHRALAPLKVAVEASVVDTTRLSPEQVVGQIMSLIQEAADAQSDKELT